MKAKLTVLLLLAAGTTVIAKRNEENRHPPTAAEIMAKLDQNKDGKISQSEFDGPAEHFSQLDKNSDGYISESEIPSGPPKDQQQGKKQCNKQSGSFINRLDTDNDGKVSKAEFDGPPEHFSELDQNSDGYLSSDEAPNGPPPRERH